jgi:hypothetical protein
MSTKLMRLILIVGISLLTLSCGQSKTGEQATNPSNDQNQSSQSGSSNQQQENQANANNPSEFNNGITAREGYEQALPKALEWSSTAVLEEVNQTTINIEGKSKSWIYYFADDMLKSPTDRSMGFYVIVGEKGVSEAKPGNISVGDNLIQANIDDWKVDAGQALAACDDAGGSELRSTNPALAMDAWLKMYDYKDPAGMPQPTLKNISWTIFYHELGEAQAMTCEVDGYTGVVFRISKELATDASIKFITAKNGFPTALAKAQEWNPAATLLSVRVEYTDENRTGPVGGLAPYWHYQFIVPPAPSGVDYQQAYDVVVGPNGLMNFRASSTYADFATYGNQSDWVIDSDEAFRISEPNGGKDYRDQHSDAQFGMELNFGFYPIDELNTMKNVRWYTGYSSESDFENELQFQIDGTTGDVVSQR